MDKSREQKVGLLPGAESIDITGNDIGFLFIHGFTGAPYEGRELVKRLNREFGFTISAPLLPGHGTSPKNLIGLKWTDWFACVRRSYLELREKCSRIVVCGLSMGGTLALHLASHYPVAGVISLAGAVFLKDWRLSLLPFARHIIPYQHKSKGPDIRNKELKKEIPSYSKYPVKSVDELLKLLQHTRMDLPEITAPAFLIHSRKDRTVHFDNLDYIYRNISSADKRKVELENSYHIVSIDVEKDLVFTSITDFLKDIL